MSMFARCPAYAGLFALTRDSRQVDLVEGGGDHVVGDIQQVQVHPGLVLQSAHRFSRVTEGKYKGRLGSIILDLFSVPCLKTFIH